MFFQITIGSVLILLTFGIAGLSLWAADSRLGAMKDWLRINPHGGKMVLASFALLVWVLSQITISVWIWATAFYVLEHFQDFETSMYFAIVSYTTLGFGDVLLPQEWRLLGGMAATNGLIGAGLYTAVLVEGVRVIRKGRRVKPSA